MNNKLKLNGVLFGLLFTMGLGSPLPTNQILKYGTLVFIGGLVTAIIYYLYYRFCVKIDREDGVFHMTPNEIKDHIKKVNPRVYRFALILYITTVLAYLSSIYLSHKLGMLISSERTYWGAWFVFGMLQYNSNIDKILERVWFRFFGTICGVLVALGLVLVVHSAFGLAIVLVIATAIYFWVAFSPKNYFHFSAAANFYVMFFYVVVMRVNTEIIWFRFAETCIAAVWVIVTIFVLWPLFRWLMPMGKYEMEEHQKREYQR